MKHACDEFLAKITTADLETKSIHQFKTYATNREIRKTEGINGMGWVPEARSSSKGLGMEEEKLR